MAIKGTERRNTPVISRTMIDQDDRKITYIQLFDGTKPIQEQIDVLSEWYSPNGLAEICASTNDLVDITGKWHDQGSCDLSPYEYYAIQTLNTHMPKDTGPVWVVWAADERHGQQIYRQVLDRRITIESLFEDRCIQSAFICESEETADLLKVRLSTI
ncbi:MAG: hypothetical protein J6D57_04550 [Mogibacterium sp.]|nr:hypothetical protein [Mogibacterium sp.]